MPSAFEQELNHGGLNLTNSTPPELAAIADRDWVLTHLAETKQLVRNNGWRGEPHSFIYWWLCHKCKTANFILHLERSHSCTHCGHEIPDGLQKCANCGAPFKD